MEPLHTSQTIKSNSDLHLYKLALHSSWFIWQLTEVWWQTDKFLGLPLSHKTLLQTCELMVACLIYATPRKRLPLLTEVFHFWLSHNSYGC